VDHVDDPTAEAPSIPSRSNPPASGLEAADVLRGVLVQFATNLLLNEPSGAASHVALSSWVQIPGRVPRRRADALEQLHQSRVSIRRLRSELRSFRGLFDAAWAESMSGELRWFGELLGEARDLSVLRELLAGAPAVDLPDERRREVTDRVEQALDRARSRANDARDCDRYRCLVSSLGSWPHSVRLAPAAHAPAAVTLAGPLAATWREVAIAARRAQSEPSSRSRHQLRIELKRLQYAAELVALAAGSPARRLARSAEALQTKLGASHDAAVAVEWLESQMVAEPELRYALAELVTSQRRAERTCRRGWRRDLTKVQRRWRRYRRSVAQHS
jgi:CHAD domain-containing protein